MTATHLNSPLTSTLPTQTQTFLASRPYTQSQYFFYQFNKSAMPGGVTGLSFIVSQLSPSPSNVDLFVLNDALSPGKVDTACPGYNNFDASTGLPGGTGSSTNGPPLGQVVSYKLSVIPDATIFYIAVSAFTAGNNLFSINVVPQGPNIFQPLVSGVPADGFALTTAPTLYAFSFTLTVRVL